MHVTLGDCTVSSIHPFHAQLVCTYPQVTMMYWLCSLQMCFKLQVSRHTTMRYMPELTCHRLALTTTAHTNTPTTNAIMATIDDTNHHHHCPPLWPTWWPWPQWLPVMAPTNVTMTATTTAHHHPLTTTQPWRRQWRRCCCCHHYLVYFVLVQFDIMKIICLKACCVFVYIESMYYVCTQLDWLACCVMLDQSVIVV